MMNIDLKLSIYKFIRNYICLRLLRMLAKDYKNWELSYQKRLERKDDLQLPGNIVPYNVAVNTLTALKITGGSSRIPIILAFYKIIHIIKKYMIKLFPKVFIKYISAYTKLRDKYPKLKYLEDILILSLSVMTASLSLRGNSNDYVLTYKVNNENSQIDFNELAGELGVNLDICEFNKSFLYGALMSRDVNDSDKVFAFREWILEFMQSSNTGRKQGLLLCLIALLIYFFINNYGLYLELIRVLNQLVESGKMSETMYKMIIRRLVKKGVKVPTSYY